MAKMIQCKTCGKEIASNAKACPSCGAKNKKPIYKRIWFIALCIIVLIVGISSLSGGDNDSSSDSTESKSASKKVEKKITYKAYSVTDLDKDLDKNAASAKDKYYNKYIKLTGILSNIDSDGKYISLRDPKDEFDLIGVQCYIQSDDQLDKVKGMSTGDTITVKGKVTDVGEVLGYQLDIDSIK